MNFIADKQTLDDLNILNRYKADSIFNIFNNVHTAGGERLLEQMFRHPLQDHAAINQRTDAIRYFQQQEIHFPFAKARFKELENYLDAGGAGNLLQSATGVFHKKIMGMVVGDEKYNVLHNGLCAAILVLNDCSVFINRLATTYQPGHPFQKEITDLQNIFSDKRLAWLPLEKNVQQLSPIKVVKYNHVLRSVMEKEMKLLLQTMYTTDVYIAAANTAKEKNFCFAKALPADAHIFVAEDLKHPCVKQAVANSLSLDEKSNVIFLTGANMAGKSTLMKSFGIAVYLAHIGFPVAARRLEFSVKNGLFSSINVSDNLNLGYSHFYAEVLRVKTVAEEVGAQKNLVVIFDELFKGTNVKDAYDATLAVTEAFSKYENCFFIISTHIVEAGEAMKERADNIQFLYLPTKMEGKIPAYTYRLEKGISADRHGMMIIENEKILETIEFNQHQKEM